MSQPASTPLQVNWRINPNHYYHVTLIRTKGKISLIDGHPLLIKAKTIIAMGAPKTGLLNALVAGDAHSQSWQIMVADLGISNTAWRKYGTRRRHGVEFGSEWVVGLRYQGGVE